MDTVFDTAADKYIKDEGGLVDNPSDPGGLTKYGIALNRNPQLTRKDILNMTIPQAKTIIRANYWDKIRADEMPAKVALSVFDSSVNQGAGQAVKLSQRAAGLPESQCDGLIGPQTLAAIKKKPELDFLAEFAVQRILHYASIPTFKVFGKGWTRRTINTLLFAINYK